MRSSTHTNAPLHVRASREGCGGQVGVRDLDQWCMAAAVATAKMRAPEMIDSGAVLLRA